MTTRKYSSRSQQTTLSAPITNVAISAAVVSASALLGGVTVSAAETFTIVIDPDTALEEVCDVSNYGSGNTLAITRQLDGSTGVAHSAGAVVRHMIIGRDLREANVHIENVASAHGLTIANVISNTQTGVVTSTMILDGTILDADINAAAAIAKTKIAGTAVVVSDTGTVTSTMILDGTIVDADINAAAAIAKTKVSGTAVTLADTATVTSAMLATATADRNQGGFKVINLGTPAAGTDAATKAYADAIIASSPSNLTGPITSVGAATAIASQTGTGTKFVVDTNPTIISPTISGTETVTVDTVLSASGAFGSVKDFQTLVLMGAL
jgi:hypothetical protein